MENKKCIKKIERMTEALEILQAVATLEYYDKNWLSNKAAINPGSFCNDKISLIKDALYFK